MKKLSALILAFFCSTSWAQVITAKSWLVADGEGHIIRSENTQEVRSIASITKLMTVMVVLDARQALDDYIRPFTRSELIQLAMVQSNNHAAQTLCENYPTGNYGCVKAMNAKAHELGMTNTRFVDPTGLGIMNVSTAEDLIKLVIAAKNYPEIVQSSQTSQVKIKQRKHFIVANNTNPIISQKYNDFIVSKTGYIRAAGGCIVMMLDTNLGRRIAVILGSKNTRTRIPEAEFISMLEKTG